MAGFFVLLFLNTVFLDTKTVLMNVYLPINF